jgi:hypothetical protein
MSLDPTNAIYVYNENNQDSYELAIQYATLYNLNDYQLVPVNCSDNEILDNYSVFQSEVETPIKLAILNLQSIYSMNVWVIVLGFNVPGGFYNENLEIISSTSRISRINFPLSENLKSNVFDRRVYQSFDSETAQYSLICSRMDGPNKQFVQDWMNNNWIMRNQYIVNRRFYFDKYSDRKGKEAKQYELNLDEFDIYLLEKLNLVVCRTVEVEPYQDAIFPFIQEDSVYWGWFTDKGSPEFFYDVNTLRFMFYNADFEGGSTIRSNDPELWPQIAISRGYVATAGSMSNMGINRFLRPYPFFYALLNGGSLGEAFLYSTTYFDSSICNFGDPLLNIQFTGRLEDSQVASPYDKKLTTEDIFQNLAIVSAYNVNRTINASIISDTIINSASDVVASLGRLTASLLDKTINRNSNPTIQQIAANFSYYLGSIGLIPGFNQYLTDNNIKISRIIGDMLRDINIYVTDNNLFDEGSWEFIYPLEAIIPEFCNYQFELQISDTSDYSNILFDIDSETSHKNWYYENMQNVYFPMPKNGVASNFAGLNIVYQSKESQYLTRGILYYFRIRQKNKNSTFMWHNYSQIIWT